MINHVLRHTSQFGAGANYAGNDCGAACLRSLGLRQNPRFNFTVDDIFRFAGVPRNATLGIVRSRKHPNRLGLLEIAAKIGIKMQHSNKLTVRGIMAEIDAGNPVLMVVYTGCFSQRPYTYAVAHYVLVTGYDLDRFVFFIMDPLSVDHDEVRFGDMSRAAGEEGTRLAGNSVAYQGLVLR